jgi:uncharacterized Zn finger protein
MQVYIPCPSCNWQEVNGNFDKYETDSMNFKLRCTRCNCLYTVKFGIEMSIEREGVKDHGR